MSIYAVAYQFRHYFLADIKMNFASTWNFFPPAISVKSFLRTSNWIEYLLKHPTTQRIITLVRISNTQHLEQLIPKSQ